MVEPGSDDSPRSEMPRCPLCGGSAPPELKKCMFCGSLLGETSTVDEPPPLKRESVDLAGAVFVALPVVAIGVLLGGIWRLSVLQGPIGKMMALYFAVGLAQAVYAYRDACELRLGEKDWRKPPLWALLVLIGWPAAVPVHLLERAKRGMKDLFRPGTAACVAFALAFAMLYSSFSARKRSVMQHAETVWAEYERQHKTETSSPLERK